MLHVDDMPTSSLTAIITLLSFYLSHFLYNCSHPNKRRVPQLDLSNDSEASGDLSVELSLSSDRLAIERVIVKTFSHHRCDVIVTDRVRTLFTSKLYCMGKLQSLGGSGCAKVVEKWKQHGPWN